MKNSRAGTEPGENIGREQGLQDMKARVKEISSDAKQEAAAEKRERMPPLVCIALL